MSLKRTKDGTSSVPKGKLQLVERIQKERRELNKLSQKVAEYDYRIKKVTESNVRNGARLLRHRARLQQLLKNRENPEILLAFSGIMNEYVQTFMISHNFQMNVDLNSLNPDTMSYEQLLELGEKIGKVSKGLTKEEIEGLEHVKMKKKEENCPICCTELQTNEMGIRLRCKHLYHEECLMEWLKEQNKCPICKQYVLEKHEDNC